MVNRYISVPASTSTAASTDNPVVDRTQSHQDSASVLSERQTPSLIDPEQFPRSSHSHASTTTAVAATAAHGHAGFSAPPPSTGLSLHELASLRERLNRIAFHPQWRDNAPAAVAELRHLLPTQLPPAYETLAWACDKFAAFTRSGSCGDSAALMDILDALRTLIEDARPQEDPFAQDLASASPPPPKRPRLDDAATASQVDTLPKSMPGNAVPSVESCLTRLEQIPANARDWTDQAAPIAKELLEVLKNDQALCSRHPFLLTLCTVFDTCNNKVVGDDLMTMLRKAVDGRAQVGTAGLADASSALPLEAATRPRPATAAAAPMDLVFGNAAENAVYGVLRDDPTMSNKEIHRKLPDWKPRAMRRSIAFVRAHIAFHLPTDKFVRILECLARSRTALSFLNGIAKDENMAVSPDWFDDLQSALTAYLDGHDGRIPSNEAEVAIFAKALKPSEPAAAIRRAATCGPPGCVSREQALSDWMAEEPGLATPRTSPQVDLPPARSGANSGGPPTVKRAVLENPSAGNTTLHSLMPDLLLSTVRKAANAARDKIAFSLPSLETILNAISIVDASRTPELFLVALGKNDLGMNVQAFPDWKIALDIYRQTHDTQIPVSEKDVEDLARCIPVSTTAAPAFWALTRGVDGYCQPIDIATLDWQKREPDKFAPFNNTTLPRSVWP